MIKKLLFTTLILFLASCTIPENIIPLTASELDYVMNYLTDYSAKGKFPDQFYLYNKDLILSSVDIIFLFLQKQAASSPFLLNNATYSFTGDEPTVQDAYNSALKGLIPRTIAGTRLESFISGNLSDFKNLNIRKRGINIALTFDIESGRYISDTKGLSPCDNENYSLGLSDPVCDDPAYVAWFSPIKDNLSYNPFLSGIAGFDIILNYSERYGLPTTNFIVTRDLLAFDTLNRKIVKRAGNLVNSGLIEIGSHTRYHTNLNLVNEELAQTELRESKLFLERFFNTTVYGFRAPYLSIIKDDQTYSQILEQAGYSYYSHTGGFGSYPGNSIIHKPWNTVVYSAYLSPKEFIDLMGKSDYLITLDHAWNLVYRDDLVEDAAISKNLQELLLSAISEGGIFVKLNDLS